RNPPAYNWPGNVRELVNFCRRATVLAPGGEIRVADLPASIAHPETAARGRAQWALALEEWALARVAAGDTPLLDTAAPEFERTLVRVALQATAGRRQEAA